MSLFLLWIVGVVFADSPPLGFVDLQKKIPTIQIQMGYHHSDNFTGAPLPGYGTETAWLTEEAANALVLVQNDLEKQGLGLLIYDAYRPKRASKAMVAWAKRKKQLHLFKQGYIAEYSGHNYGHTVDLTILDLKTGIPLDMGGD